MYRGLLRLAPRVRRRPRTSLRRLVAQTREPAEWIGTRRGVSTRRTVTAAEVAVLPVSVAVGFLSPRIDSVFLPASFAMAAVVVLAVRAPRAVVLATLLFLPFLALLRRVSGSYLATVDPLAVAGLALAVLCLLVLSFGQQAGPRTPLAATVTAMICLGLLQIANPAQGGPVIGAFGAGLFVGPMVWFFIGHRVGDAATLALVTRALRVVVVVVALYGVKQVLFGFTAFEDRWVASQRGRYAALGIGDSIRPFSTFASGAEYSYFLVLGPILFTTWSSGVGWLRRTVVVLTLLVASFYAGSRGIFVTAVLGTVTVALVQRVRNLSKAVVLCLAFGVLGLLLLRLVPLSAEDTAAGAIQNRTLTGLSRPFDPEVSTLGIHIDSFGRGMAQGLRSPLGQGAASVNLAGAKLSGKSLAAEHDVPNMLLAYGWLGGLLLIMLLVRTYRLLRACVRQRRRELLGPAVFVLTTFGVWFVGELYAVTAILWFFLGALDRLEGEGWPTEGVPIRDRS